MGCVRDRTAAAGGDASGGRVSRGHEGVGGPGWRSEQLKRTWPEKSLQWHRQARPHRPHQPLPPSPQPPLATQQVRLAFTSAGPEQSVGERDSLSGDLTGPTLRLRANSHRVSIKSAKENPNE
ncbi:hypothetical protein EYF80_058834 [Liparis tanakae]|uniref:Uncharacterized protein n=1 Tax=Liparis tanakae TaxID=230148 RepID=A0A4Z2ERL6_9TELE|nr:hypothetical protein EYF80_058834 [Liparis tanakae]